MRPRQMMTRCLRGVLVCLALFATSLADARADENALAGPKPAAEGCAEQVVARVQTRYESVRDFRARFEQSTERVGFPGDRPGALRAGGEVFFQKPGRMHWAYHEPAPSFVISNGSGAWVYDPIAEEAQYFELGGDFLSGAALQFLLGDGKILDAFRVRAPSCDLSRDVLIELLPLEPASFERLDLLVDPKSGDVSETRVVDLLGNRTRLILRDSRFGDVPAADHFEFEPPPGTRVLSLPARGAP